MRSTAESSAAVAGLLPRLVATGKTDDMKYGVTEKKLKTTKTKTIFVNCLSNSRRTSGTVL